MSLYDKPNKGGMKMLNKLRWWLRKRLGCWVEVTNENELKSAISINSIKYIVIRKKTTIVIKDTIIVPSNMELILEDNTSIQEV